MHALATGRATIGDLGHLNAGRDLKHASSPRDAAPAGKAAIYDQLDLKVTFKPGEAKLRAKVTISPENYIEHVEQGGDTGRVRGGT